MYRRTVVHVRFDSTPAGIGDAPLATMLRSLDFILSITAAQIGSMSAPDPHSSHRKTVAGWIGDGAQVRDTDTLASVRMMIKLSAAV